MRLMTMFQRLNWKLTFSYTLVTVGTLLVLELCILAGIQAVASTDALAWTVAGTLQSDVLPGLQQVLQDEPLNTSALQDGLARWFPAIDETTADDPAAVTGIPLAPDDHAAVLDAEGRLLAYQPAGPAASLGEPFDAQRIPMLADILPAALANETNLSRLSRRDGALVTIALPITSTDNRLLGVLVVHTRQTRSLADNLWGILQLLGLSFALFTLLAGVIGTVFGFFTARSLTSRLKHVAETSSAWGRGDFNQTIQDASPDELGQLAGQLNAMSAQLQELIQARQQIATMDERNRLARDLHDSVKQQVFAISMNLGAIQSLWGRDPDKALARLEATTQLTHQAQQELTELIQALRPRALENYGLAQALPKLLKEWEALHGVQTACQIHCQAAASQAVEQALFRIAQETLANTAKHSGASHLRLELHCDAAHITLKIEDDGHGFDIEQPSTGFGLHSMRERAAALGGSLELSSDAQGTRLTATLPNGGRA